jgi:quinol monooxygenase YgiN
MPYVRVTTMIARAGQEARLEKTMRDLSAFYAQQPGYIHGYTLLPHEQANPRRFGRVGVWENEHAAVDAAQRDHALALRSELLRILVEELHDEYSFIGEADTK